ncbi:putative sugar O-methyltransferase [Leptospira idonii]|uniref:Putative sugar O-methyltransferase n=1 Tax=Leptospira idonii TaxID=1193500 RepID=A0A4R9LYJ7_9LEPT|nr:putative sugar O-methyltransferase [Leptospira idonii]TGN18792.1 putative sugar O-methyltransferase [Leptospira idonii]
MLEELEKAPEIYRPTNYWYLHQKVFLNELSKTGLFDFRRRKYSILETFGATDYDFKNGAIDVRANKYFNNRYVRSLPFWAKFIEFINRKLNLAFPIIPAYNIDYSQLKVILWERVDLLAKKIKAKPLASFSSSLIGNPEDVISVDGKNYTLTVLYYYLRYLFCQKNIDLSKVKVIAELGSGAGKQVEVLKKLYPDMIFLLFDIPPQLYVSQTYLSTLFPNDVVPFQDTLSMDNIDLAKKGKIYFFGNWKFPILKNHKIDLFWNAASFQEMEPDVVSNYLSIVNMSAKTVFLQQRMEGKETASKKGEHGVLKATTLEDYKENLSNFKLVQIEDSLTAFGTLKGYSDSFWKRK